MNRLAPVLRNRRLLVGIFAIYLAMGLFAWYISGRVEVGVVVFLFWSVITAFQLGGSERTAEREATGPDRERPSA
ncbi:MAG TPA: hypothetical protein VFN71_15015 [Methylomirabilota bacterium]|nr:hypothetical protein [Methylomirabilota bacterium]